MNGRRTGLAGITFLVLFAILGIGLVAGWKAISAPVPGLSEDTASDGPTCRDLAPGDVVRTADVTVSVFNAGSRSGLADQTLGELTARGFIKGEVGNAPGELGNVRIVRVLAPSRNDPAAQLVARQFGPDTLVQPRGQDLGPGVDVIVGDKFAGAGNGPKSYTAKADATICSPTLS